MRQETQKRIFDAATAFVLLLLLSPLFLLLGLILFFFNNKKVFFVQERVGLHQTVFKIIKFSTMSDKRDSVGTLLPDEDRITVLGKWLRSCSLDELPQLLNVLKGDMSLVGPRPLLTEYLPYYNTAQRRRHEVKPGITGWAQINGRNSICWEKKFDLDLWYVEHQSLRLDIKILYYTLIRVGERSGINQENYVSMEPFRGAKQDV